MSRTKNTGPGLALLSALRPHWKWFLLRHTLLGAAETAAGFAVMTIFVFWQAASSFNISDRPELGADEFHVEFFSYLWHHFGSLEPYRYFGGLIFVTVIVYLLFVIAQVLAAWTITNRSVLQGLPPEIVERITEHRDTDGGTISLDARKSACKRAITGTVLLRRTLPTLGLVCYGAWSVAAYLSVIHGNDAFRATTAQGPGLQTMAIGTSLIGLWVNFLYFVRLHEFDPIPLWTSEMSEEERNLWRKEMLTSFKSRTLIDSILASSTIVTRRSIYAVCTLGTFPVVMLTLAAVLPYWPGHWLASFVQVTVILSFVVLLVVDRFVGKINQTQIGDIDPIEVTIALAFSRLPRRAAVSETWARVGIVDSLTEVATRLRFETQVRELIAKRNTSFALALIDMDDFKSINTIFMHDGGDRALRYIGHRLQTLAPECIVGRLGGDEFAAVIPGDKEKSLRLLNHWRLQTMERANLSNLGGIASYMKLSIGVVYHSASTANGDVSPRTLLESLIGEADRLAFEAKDEGKNGIMSSDSALADKRSEQRKLEDQERRLLKLGFRWPALQDVVSWEVVETRRALQAKPVDETLLRTRRRHMILLDRRMTSVQGRLKDVRRQCEDHRDNPPQAFESTEQAQQLDSLATIGFRLCRLVRSALRSGIRPSFREGAITQLDIFMEKLNRFHHAFTSAREGKTIFLRDLMRDIGVDDSSPSESRDIIARIPRGYTNWPGFVKLIEREKQAILHSSEATLDEHYNQISHLDRKCSVLEKMLEKTGNSLSVTSNAESEGGRTVRNIRAAKIVESVTQQMVSFGADRTLQDANAVVSEHIVHIGVVEDIVSTASYEDSDEQLREIGERYGIF